jgi:hypothetical protein
LHEIGLVGGVRGEQLGGHGGQLVALGWVEGLQQGLQRGPPRLKQLRDDGAAGGGEVQRVPAGIRRRSPVDPACALYGARRWRASLQTRFVVLLALLAATAFPLAWPARSSSWPCWSASSAWVLRPDLPARTR